MAENKSQKHSTSAPEDDAEIKEIERHQGYKPLVEGGDDSGEDDKPDDTNKPSGDETDGDGGETDDQKKEREEKEAGDANEAKGLNRDGSKKKEDDSSDDDDDSGDDGADDDDTSTVEPLKRTPRHIPIGKYTSEKNEWKTQMGAKETEIADLKTQLEKGAGSGQPAEKTAEEINKWAEDNNFAPDAVQQLVGILKKELKIELPKEQLEKLDQASAAAAQQQDVVNFNKEFDDEVTPLIEKEFPNASKEKVQEVKKDLDDLSHTEGNESTLLRHLFHDNKDRYSDTLKPPKKKSAESGTIGKTDIETGNTLAEIYKMGEGEEQNKLIEKMSGDEYDKYVAYVSEVEGAGGLIHRRGNKTIK